MMRFAKIFCLLVSLTNSRLNAQGLLNNGATIILNNGVKVTVKNASGNYLSQSNGHISNLSGGGYLYIEGNWTNNSANTGFLNDGTTVILSGTNQNIGGSSSTLFYNLLFSNPGTKTLLINASTGGVAGTGTLNLSGSVLDLNSYTLSINNNSPAAVSYGSGYIQSETNLSVNPSVVKWNTGSGTGNYVFPFGASGSQIPFSFSITAPMPSSSDYIAVSTRATVAPDNLPWAGAGNAAAVSNMYCAMLNRDGSADAVIDRWWDIHASSVVTADLIFSYLGTENTMSSSYNTGGIQAQHWNGNSWDIPVGMGFAVQSGVGTCTVTGASTFSPWVLSSVTSPLPVELIAFDFSCQNGIPLLQWATATETNNDYFEIEESADGITYLPVAKIKGAGSTLVRQNYTQLLTGYTSSKPYYRLKQTDFNSNYHFSPLLFINSCSAKQNTIDSYFSSGNIYLLLQTDPETDIALDLYDMNGKKTLNTHIHSTTGTGRQSVEAYTVAPGIYTLHLQWGNNNAMVKKLVILPNQ